MKDKSIYLTLAVVALILMGASAPNMYEIVAPFTVFRVTNPIVAFNGTLSYVSAAGTVLETLSGSTGQRTGRLRPVIASTSATPAALTVSDCGSVVVSNRTSTTQTWVLPAVATAGCKFTFLTGHADSETLINAAASGTCVVTAFSKVGAANVNTAIVTDASCDTGLKNTAATNAIGDSITLVSNGTQWRGQGIASGIWAAQ